MMTLAVHLVVSVTPCCRQQHRPPEQVGTLLEASVGAAEAGKRVELTKSQHHRKSDWESDDGGEMSSTCIALWLCKLRLCKLWLLLLHVLIGGLHLRLTIHRLLTRVNLQQSEHIPVSDSKQL